MTGRLAYSKDGATELKRPRLRVEFARGGVLEGEWQRRLGRIGLIDDPDDFIADKEFGPDALTLGVGLRAFRHLLADRRGPVKSALMDQSLLAGIGNVYSDEMLFQVCLHPRRVASGLDRDNTARLHRAMGRVLRTAIRHHADPARMPKGWLLPHRKPGAACPRCGGTVSRQSVGGRSAYLCPKCQAC